MTVDQETIKKRIDEIAAERDKYVAKANMQVAAYNGAIQALEGLLVPKDAALNVGAPTLAPEEEE